jgi:hypothetical protein
LPPPALIARAQSGNKAALWPCRRGRNS